MDLTESLKISRISGRKREETEDIVTKEASLTIFLNGKRVKRLSCSPDKLKELSLGFLYSQGKLEDLKDLKSLKWDERKGTIKVKTLTPAPKKPRLLRVRSNLRIKKESIFSLALEAEKRSRLFQTTGGVHSACLTDRKKKIILFAEDIGRQNALDKIIGESLLKNVSLQNKIMLSSGRITSETIAKMVRAKIPIIVSPGAPTDLAVNLARRLGITVVGFARRERMNIYSHPERII